MKKLLLFLVLLVPLASSMPVNEWEKYVHYRSIVLYAPAVAESENGYVGVLTEINVTMMNGSGNVYVITTPLTELDMQGSAKLAVDVAGMLTGKDVSKYDFIFQVKSASPIVGGPSAGGVMCIAVICLLENLETRDDVIMTGMINPDGSIGPVGGILEKGEAAGEAGMKYFLIPKGQSIGYKVVKETVGGWVIYKRELINISKELYENYGLIVKEVEDVNEALAYFTGYSFEEEKYNATFTTGSYYNKILDPLAEQVINEANASYEKAKKIFEESNVPVGYPWYSPRGTIRKYLNEAEEDLEKAKEAYEYKEFYYYSISKAFQSKIKSRFVMFACDYYKGMSIKEIKDNVSKVVKKALEYSEKAKINGLVSLQCIGGAQQRALEAKEFLNDTGRNSLEQIYNLAYSMERSHTVYWWINLSKEFEETYFINESWIDALAEKYYSYAQNIVSYAEIIAQETGYSKDFVNEANNLLQKASEQKDDYPAASLFNSLEAIANANIAIELVGIDKAEEIKDRLNRTSQMASYAIHKARNMGIEPILAISYYEFGRSLENDDVKDALIYYKYASMIANMLCLAKGFEVKNMKKVNVWNVTSTTKNSINIEIIIGASSFILGTVAGFVIGRRKESKESRERETTPDEAAENLRYFFDENFFKY